MQAGHELDVKVAEALGYEVGKFPPDYYIVVDGDIETLPHFSTTWGGMGVLVEEAKKQGIYLEYEHYQNNRYLGRYWEQLPAEQDWLLTPASFALNPPEGESAPHAVALAYLMARGAI
ncbi:hypothetical protein [Brevibacillus porteri]|uniref:hypothetical protein n=1 Tax=Brevibacillus porteri TaxID=2126350 RepID=UPI00362EA7A5